MTNTFTVKTSETISWIEKHSRFIAIAKSCNNIASFESCFSELKTIYPDANHIVYAYVIIEDDTMRIKCSDDGEPSGTAGRPILSHIQGKKLVDTAIFVIRYFGGVKLGAGGLVRAYSHSARLALEAAELAPFKRTIALELSVAYEEQKNFEYQLKRINGVLSSTVYESKINYTFLIEESHYEAFKKLFPQCRKL